MSEDNAARRTSEEQVATVELRERFLRMLSGFGGKQVKIVMYENILLNGTFVAAQKTNDHYLVDNLETPRGKINHTVLRMRDTLTISVPWTELTSKS